MVTRSEKVWSVVGLAAFAAMLLSFCFAPVIFRGFV